MLNQDYAKDIKSGVLQLIYKRYKRALEILENNKEIKEINILGGVRTYMDSYNDYQNPLLGELHKVEKIIKELIILKILTRKSIYKNHGSCPEEKS